MSTTVESPIGNDQRTELQAAVLTGVALPPGYGSVNPFVAVGGPGGVPAFVRFLEEVFGARETLAAHTVDTDGLLIHAEARIGDSTIMMCDAKPHWPGEGHAHVEENKIHEFGSYDFEVDTTAGIDHALASSVAGAWVSRRRHLGLPPSA